MTPENFVLPSPGKLNLFLHIVGRRTSGFHELQTLFQLVEYADEMRFESASNSHITVEGDFGALPVAENLIFKAAGLLRQVAGTKRGAIIRVKKVLPIGGGMGGGSSNAATTLIGLSMLWNTHVSYSEMIKIGLELGADVPLFIAGKTAWGEGIGERLTPLSVPEKWYLVVMPDCRVSTAEIFQNQHLTRDSTPITIARFLEQDGPNSHRKLDLNLHNDCESVVRKLYPKVDAALNWLSRWSPARITGTGAAVFSVFDYEEDARQVLAQMPGNLAAILTKGVNVSPLHQAMTAIKARIE